MSMFSSTSASGSSTASESSLSNPAGRRPARQRFGAARFASALLLAAVGAAAGCGDSGPPLGVVEGVVKYDGKPLTDATLHFQPRKGAPSFGKTDAKGAYKLKYTAERFGALVGPHSVRITTARTTEDAKGVETEIPERLPPVYNVKSTLTREVKTGENRFDFDLQSKPAPQTARR